MKMIKNWGWLVLFASFSTLTCCVLPIILVSFGMGAVVAVLYGNLPFLTFLSVHKIWTFSITAAILIAAAWSLFRPSRACPSEPKLAKACASTHKWNVVLFWISAALWSVSFSITYLL